MKRLGWFWIGLLMLFFNLEGYAYQVEVIPINSVEDFLAIESDHRYQIMQDLDFMGVDLSPISARSNVSIDGNHKVLRNIHIHSEEAYVGLFTELSQSSIKNLRIEHLTVMNDYIDQEGLFNYATGGLVALATDTQFESIVMSHISVRSQSDVVGGLIGKGQGIRVERVILHGQLVGRTYVGGVIGYVGVLDPFANQNIETSSSFKQVAFHGQLEFEWLGAGLIGAMHDETVDVEEVSIEIDVVAQGALGMVIGEINEAKLRLSDVLAQVITLNEAYDVSFGYPSLVHAFIEDYPRLKTLNIHRAIVRAPWANVAVVNSDEPYLQTHLLGDDHIDVSTIFLNDVYYDQTMYQTLQLGYSASAQLQDLSYFTNFDFDDVWAIHPNFNQTYPYLVFKTATIFDQLDLNLVESTPFFITHAIEDRDHPLRQ